MSQQGRTHMTTLRLNTLAIAVGLAFSSSAVFAEQAQVQAEKNIEQISVLGSRVSNRTATESSSPIDLIDADTLNKGGFTELGQSLQATAPSFNFSRTQVSDGSDLFRPATLRGLQPDQTLVLVNGKRRHNQSIFGLVGTVGAGATMYPRFTVKTNMILLHVIPLMLLMLQSM